MTGVTTGLLARTKGATINPNLELLFNGPTLRPFSFQFRLSARNKTEAEEIIKIIRFFKQGMAPIRTEGNLFLLAPHTFQIHFVHAKGKWRTSLHRKDERVCSQNIQH